METATAEKPKIVLRNKFSRKTVAKRKVPRVDITDRDLRLFKLLTEVKYASLDYVFAWLNGFGGTDYQSFSKHVTLLFLNGYVDMPFFQTKTRRADRNFRIIELTQKGADELKKTVANVPRILAVGNAEHKNIGCVYTLSTMLAERELETVKVIRWPEIRSKPEFPQDTLKLARPMAIRFEAPDNDGVIKEHLIEPDDVFMLSYNDEAFRFCVREDDNSTEANWSDFQNTIKWKTWAYYTILRDEIYADHYGVSSFFPIFNTVSKDRADAIILTIERVALEYGFDPELAQNILVTHTPMFNSRDEEPAPPTGHALTRKYRRAFGFPDLNISQP